MRTSVVAALGLVLAAASAGGAPCAAQSASPLELARVGVTDSFGPGIMAVTEGKVEFRLTRPAHVVLLWITPDGHVDVFFPLHSGDRTLRRAGRHALSVNEVPSPIEPPLIPGAPVSSKPGQFTGAGPGAVAGRADPSDDLSGYWGLIVSDTPIGATEVRARLATMSREGGGVAVLDRAPELLMLGRPGLWAAYYLPVVFR